MKSLKLINIFIGPKLSAQSIRYTIFFLTIWAIFLLARAHYTYLLICASLKCYVPTQKIKREIKGEKKIAMRY